MFSCCGDYLVGGRIKKAHCVDAELLQRLFPDPPQRIGLLAEHPTRKECGCAECTDIGAYDTCAHGCVYCYANTREHIALRYYKRHDPCRDLLAGHSLVSGTRSVPRRDSTPDGHPSLDLQL